MLDGVQDALRMPLDLLGQVLDDLAPAMRGLPVPTLQTLPFKTHISSFLTSKRPLRQGVDARCALNQNSFFVIGR